MKRKICVFLAVAVSLGVFAAPGYAWKHVYWKPARMAATIVAAQFIPNLTAAQCAGVGKPVRGGYASFRCTYTWQITVGSKSNSGTRGPLWARPLPSGRICASTVSLARCKPYGP